MKADGVKPGGFYASDAKGLIREITSETELGTVLWQSYDILTGKPTGDYLSCSKQRIAQWANREASAEEIARIRSRPTYRRLEAIGISELVPEFLKMVSDDELLAEVKRRGLE